MFIKHLEKFRRNRNFKYFGRFALSRFLQFGKISPFYGKSGRRKVKSFVTLTTTRLLMSQSKLIYASQSGACVVAFDKLFTTPGPGQLSNMFKK